jgi:hypothetical protein
MEIVLLRTGGAGKAAIVELPGGAVLTVQDGISRPGEPHPSGVVYGAAISYVSISPTSWSEAIAANPAHRQQLVRVQGWSYEGFGRVASVMPPMIDFGVLTMEDANWTDDERLVGKFVRIEIDRLEVTVKPELAAEDEKAARH